MTLAASLRMPWAGAWADAVPDPDAALLRRYAADRDAAAFAVLVRRHGPLVFGVCLRTAGHRADAEDAFQAVFLVLAEKAGCVARPELLGNWLYGVAVRVGRKARRAARRRHLREAAMADIPRPTAPDAGWSDAAPVIDEELGRLAEHYRSAVLLCDVQGLSRAEAAARLGIPEGTLSSRLNAGRKKLAERLMKRGVTLTVTVVGPLLVANATAAVPDELAGRLAAFLQHLSAGDPIGGPVGDLIREGFPVRTKLWAGLVVAGLGAGLTFAAWPGGDDKPKADPPVAKKPDEPKAEGKTTKPAKAKLIDTISVDAQLGGPMWSDDGKTIYVTYATEPGTRGAVARSSLAGFETASGRSSPERMVAEVSGTSGNFLGFFNGGQSYAYYTAAGRRINAPDMITLMDLVAKKVNGASGATMKFVGVMKGSAEVELAEVGKPFAISPDGKVVFSEQVKATGDDVAVTIRVLDPKTGDAVRTLGTFGGENLTVRGYKLSRAADRLFVYLHGPDYVTVECIDVANSKTVWNVQFPDRPRPTTPDGRRAPLSLSSNLLVPSRDGKLVAVHLARGADGAEARVLNAATGKEVVELQGVPAGGAAVPLDFSHDGRLLVGKTSYPRDRNQRGGFGGGEGGGVPAGPLGGPGGQTGPDQLVVWDLKTGKVLRAWDDQLRVEVAFAPDRPVLAVVESERTMTGPRGGGGGGGGFNADRGGGRVGGGGGPADPAAAPTVTYRSTIGFWDLAPLVK
ncbi:MAG: sigma-70 family RNA polymerase sigma factor [Gemmataceae bacterium]